MRLFGKKKASVPVISAIRALMDRTTTLESEFRNLKLDYLETYDKVNRMMARVAKRAAIDNPKLPDPPPEPPDELSRSDRITAEIMERRSRSMN